MRRAKNGGSLTGNRRRFEERAMKMRAGMWFLVFASMAVGLSCQARPGQVLLDDFEGVITGGVNGTVDFGAGSGSNVQVVANREIKYSGDQSLEVVYDAAKEGYLWVARGFGLDAKNTAWLVAHDKIPWQKFTAFSFYMYGSDSKAKIAFDIKDSGNEYWRFMVEDNFTGWKQIVCPFASFFARGDWQPTSADKNAVLNFPVKSFQFEPRPPARGTLYFDRVELISQ
jgi:hypothetical protein